MTVAKRFVFFLALTGLLVFVLSNPRGLSAEQARIWQGEVQRVAISSRTKGVAAPAGERRFFRGGPFLKTAIIGTPGIHSINPEETLLDIARQYGLGINELQDLYPSLDPWIPPEKMKLVIPSQWVLPETPRGGIVINVAELRLYFVQDKDNLVRTYPVGIGDREFATPEGLFKVGAKRANPTWFIPESLQEKYGVKAIPPGADNPLGDYWIGLAGSDGYGIHGTDIPWSVGRLVTHGCIRLYPEDIKLLFKMVRPGTTVQIIYEPVKIALGSKRVYAEVHQDIYGRIEDFVEYGRKRLEEEKVLEQVDLEKFGQVLARQSGQVVDVTQGAAAR